LNTNSQEKLGFKYLMRCMAKPLKQSNNQMWVMVAAKVDFNILKQLSDELQSDLVDRIWRVLSLHLHQELEVGLIESIQGKENV